MESRGRDAADEAFFSCGHGQQRVLDRHWLQV